MNKQIIQQLFDQDCVLDSYGRLVIQNEEIMQSIHGALDPNGLAVIMPDGSGCGCNGSCD